MVSSTNLLRQAARASPLNSFLARNAITPALSGLVASATSLCTNSHIILGGGSSSSTTMLEPGTRKYSTYEPPANNIYHGEPVYTDIDISTNAEISSAASARNSDPEAVFVVTGEYLHFTHISVVTQDATLKDVFVNNMWNRCKSFNGIAICERTSIKNQRTHRGLCFKTRFVSSIG